MACERHTPDQILAKLSDADVLLAQGASVADVMRKPEVIEQTYHRRGGRGHRSQRPS